MRSFIVARDAVSHVLTIGKWQAFGYVSKPGTPENRRSPFGCLWKASSIGVFFAALLSTLPPSSSLRSSLRFSAHSSSPRPLFRSAPVPSCRQLFIVTHDTSHDHLCRFGSLPLTTAPRSIEACVFRFASHSGLEVRLDMAGL